MEIIGDYGKHYANGFEYAKDTHRFDKPMVDGKGTIDIRPSWAAWAEVVGKNEKLFKEMTKDEVDGVFSFFDGGFQYGILAGLSGRL